MDYKEIDLYQFSTNVFTNSCKDPMSIQLTVEDDKDILDIFEMLIIIFTEGMKKKFGNYDSSKNMLIVDLDYLTPDDFSKINQYFNSFGFNCIYQVTNYNDFSISNYQIEDIIIDTRNISQKKSVINQNTKLSNIKYTIKSNSDIVYTIHFDFYQHR